MRHQRVDWHHNFEDEPVVLWSEVGEDGYERRKVDQYRDGRLDYADDITAVGTTRLGDQPVPSVDQINADVEFTAANISAAEFDAVWKRARQMPPAPGAVR
jgi:hypothetical protein